MLNKLFPLDFQRDFPTSGPTDYVPAKASTQVHNRREFLRNKLFSYCEVCLFQCSVSSSNLRNSEILKGMMKTIIHKCWIVSRNNCLKYPTLATPVAGNVIFNKTKELFYSSQRCT